MPDRGSGAALAGRDLEAAGRRAELEGGAPQSVGPAVALGGGGFAADSAPDDALIAVPDGAGGWALGETVDEARRVAGKVQGRRTTVAAEPPLPLPEGLWDLTLRTSWVEPGYLEPDAAWCVPGADPVSPLANGGAFGGKTRFGTPARPGSWPIDTAVRCWCCTPARIACAWVPSARPSRPGPAPMGPASCTWSAPRG